MPPRFKKRHKPISLPVSMAYRARVSTFMCTRARIGRGVVIKWLSDTLVYQWCTGALEIVFCKGQSQFPMKLLKVFVKRADVQNSMKSRKTRKVGSTVFMMHSCWLWTPTCPLQCAVVGSILHNGYRCSCCCLCHCCCLCWISDTSNSLDAVCNVRTTSIGESGIVPGEDLSAERPQSKALLQQCKTSKSRWRTCICYLCCVLPCWRSSTNAIFLIELLINIWCTKYLLVLLFLFFGWPYVLFLPWFPLLPVPGCYDPLRQENQGARRCCSRYCKLVAYDYYPEVYRVSVVAILLGVWMSW